MTSPLGNISIYINKYICEKVADFVTALLKGKAGVFGIKAGDSQAGKLKTMYEGVRPKGYEVMKKQGAIILGTY